MCETHHGNNSRFPHSLSYLLNNIYFRFGTRLYRFSFCFVYLTELLLALSHDIEVNPDPRPPKLPCGSYRKALVNDQNERVLRVML